MLCFSKDHVLNAMVAREGELYRVGPPKRKQVTGDTFVSYDILGPWLCPCLLSVLHEISSSDLSHASCQDVLNHSRLEVKGPRNNGLKPLPMMILGIFPQW